MIDVLSEVFGCQDEYESNKVSSDLGYITDHMYGMDFNDNIYSSDIDDTSEE